jgi:hypothetical protein
MRIRGALQTMFALLCVSVCMVGCTDLSAVRDFAQISYRAADYTALVDGYAAFPGRQKQYAPEARHAALDQIQKDRMRQKNGLLALHTRVQEYMEALGKLAADESVNFDKEFSELETALTDSSFASEPQAAAATQLGQLLAKATTDTWRRKKIHSLIEEGNEPLQTVLTALQNIVKGAFIEDLEQETQVVNTFYAALQQDSQDRAAIQALKEWKDTHERKLKQDRKAAQAYSNTIGTMMEAHQKLYDSRDDLANKDVLSAIQGYVTQLKKLEKTLRSLT